MAIVVHYEYEKAAAAVRSIEKWTGPAISKKIYIIDNSESAGEGQEEFKRFLSGYGDIEYIPDPSNPGFGAGQNKVLGRLDSQYHAIVNPDILLTEDVFSSMISFLDQNPDVGMVAPRLLDEEGNLQKAYRKDPTVLDMGLRMFCKGHFQKRQDAHTLQDQDYGKVFDVPFAQGSFLVVRTSLFQEIGGFDERYFLYMEDADLCRRVREKARVVYYPGASVVHKWERGSHKNPRLFREHVKSMKKYFKKWGMRWK